MIPSDITDKRTEVPAPEQPARGIALHIDRLVIDGLPVTAGQSAQLQQALHRELTRLLASNPGRFTFENGAVPVLSASPIQIPSPFQPADLGRQIARSLFESLSKPL